MVMWKVYGVVFLCICVFSKCVSSAGARNTGITPKPSYAPFFGVAKTTARVEDESVSTASSLDTTEFSCDKCVHGYCKEDKCLCRPGWKGLFCDSDIDECKVGRHRCHPELGICSNTIGSYSCSCKEGLDGDGFTCEVRLFRYNYNTSSPKRSDDKIYGPYPVIGGLSFLGKKYEKLYVSTNGYISLDKKYSKVNPFADDTFPTNAAIIAPFWTDLDLSIGPGALYVDVYSAVNQTKQGAEIFSQFKNDITRWRNITFAPTFVLIVTWENARAYPVYLFNETETVSFQAVLATDSNQSFLLLDYGSGIMKWGTDVQWSNHPIMLGYSNGSPQGRRVIVSDVYRPDLGSNIKVTGKYLYRLGAPIINHDIECWTFKEAPQPTSHPQCPCELVQLKIDFMYRRVRDACYVHRTMDNDNRIPPKDKFAPCCYNNATGALLPAQAVMQSSDGHQRYDTYISLQYRSAYQACCVKSNLCHIFYKMYQDYRCDNYEMPLSSMVHGCVTFKSWYRLGYSTFLEGEFVLANVNNGSFNLQLRAGTPVTTVSVIHNLTVPTAFAAQDYASDLCEVRWTADGDAVIHVDGVKVGTLRHSLLGTQIWHKGVAIERLHATEANNTEDVVMWFNATQIALRVHQTNGRLSLIAVMDKRYRVSVEGVLSVYGDMESNIYTYPLRNGTPSTFETMMTDWAVQANESMFSYNIDRAINKDFVVPELSFPDFAVFYVVIDLNFCWQYVSCHALSYTSQLGDDNFTWATHNEEQYFEYLHYYVYDNAGPIFYDEPVFRVELWKPFTLTLDVIDEYRDSFHIQLETNIPAKSHSFVEKKKKFEWRPDYEAVEGSGLYAKFTAIDYFAMVTFFWPRLELCACMHGSKCSFDYLKTDQHAFSPEKFYVAECECTENFKARFCNQKKEPCSPNPCYQGSECHSVSSGYQCDSCPRELSGDGTKCGASCHKGFHLLDDGTCADVDECDVECTELGQYCVNTVGSFQCKCRKEYIASASGVACLFAPKRYYVNLTFAVMKTAEGYIPYSSEMNNVGSELFKMVEENVVRMLKGVFEGLGLVAAHVAEISHTSKQMPVVLVKLYFIHEAMVNVERLESYIEKRNYKIHAEKLIDVSSPTVKEWDLCANEDDNTCDVNTTVCTMADGRFVCVCKDGFNNLDRDNRCRDVCDGRLCKNGGVCERVGHAYLCICPEFWMGQNCTMKNEPAIRYRSTVIALGAAFSVISVILLVALLATVIRIRRGQTTFRCKRALEDQLSDAAVKVQSANPIEQQQSLDGENDKSKEVQAAGTGAVENPACTASTSDLRRHSSVMSKGPRQMGDVDSAETPAI